MRTQSGNGPARRERENMNNGRKVLLIAAACLGAAACDFKLPGSKPATPTGQVVATVEGQEITLRELDAELNGVTFADAKQRKAGEAAALQQIIARKVIAKEAEAEGLDKTPDFALQKERLTENLLAQALEQKIMASLPPTTHDEAQNYVSDHPDRLAERKVLVVDQIRAQMPPDPQKFGREMGPIKTMDDAAALLTQEHIAFQRGGAQMDTLQMSPDMADKILALPPNEVFVFPINGVMLINQIKSVQVVPVTGDAAIAYATQFLRQQHARDAVKNEFAMIGSKALPTVRYNPAYAPPKPASASDQAKPAAAPAAANTAAP